MSTFSCICKHTTLELVFFKDRLAYKEGNVKHTQINKLFSW